MKLPAAEVRFGLLGNYSGGKGEGAPFELFRVALSFKNRKRTNSLGSFFIIRLEKAEQGGEGPEPSGRLGNPRFPVLPVPSFGALLRFACFITIICLFIPHFRSLPHNTQPEMEDKKHLGADKEGHLEIYQKFPPLWKRRFFSLRGNCLFYFKEKGVRDHKIVLIPGQY